MATESGAMNTLKLHRGRYLFCLAGVLLYKTYPAAVRRLRELANIARNT
jgi:hypothetical protein